MRATSWNIIIIIKIKTIIRILLLLQKIEIGKLGGAPKKYYKHALI